MPRGCSCLLLILRFIHEYISVMLEDSLDCLKTLPQLTETKKKKNPNSLDTAKSYPEALSRLREHHWSRDMEWTGSEEVQGESVRTRWINWKWSFDLLRLVPVPYRRTISKCCAVMRTRDAHLCKWPIKYLRVA